MAKVPQNKIPGKEVPAKKAGRQPGQIKLDVTCSRQFTSWLQEHNLSLAFTTYQAGKVFFIGSTPNGKVTVFNRNFQRVMGLCCPAPNTLWMSTLYQLWRLENTLEPGQMSGHHDKVYVPQVSYVTGDVDAHDIAVDEKGVPIFVNTMFSCLARPSVSRSFAPVWKPPFISRLAAEDRCHLNGLAMDGFEPAYVTAVATTDVHGGWREHRRDGGVVIDVRTNDIVCEGLSMPHSPRLHNGELYVLNSGEGYFGKVDRKTGNFEPITFIPGYARGMGFFGDFAIVGLSQCRENRTFSGLNLDKALDEKKVQARAGLQVIDLRTGDSVHFLELKGDVRELYDVVAIPQTQSPSALGFMTDEIRRSISIQPVEGIHPAPKKVMGGKSLQERSKAKEIDRELSDSDDES